MGEGVRARAETEGGDEATRVFTGHRELLFSIVYSMLGSVADTEDVLQETWLSWEPRSRAAGEDRAGPIENPRAYLVRIAVNHALARQAAISRRRETYVGPWLPEPLVGAPAGGPGEAGDRGDAGDPAGPAERAEAVSMALMVVLETLTPLERAVFVLHEVFGYPHPETAALLGRSPAAVRQLAHRAREHVHARRPRYRPDRRLRQEVTERFVAAVSGGDLEALLALLAPEVTLWADGGGKARAAGLWPVRGRDRIARLLTASAARRRAGLGIRYRLVNGDPSAVLFTGDAPFAVIVLDLVPEGGRVRGIYAVTNPDKLSRVAAPDA